MSKWLLPEEQVIVMTRYYAGSLWRAAAITIMLPTLIGFCAAWISRRPWPVEWESLRGPATALLLALGVLLLLLGPVKTYMRWLSSYLILTNQRLVLRSGTVSRKQQEIPLVAVRSVKLEQNMLQRFSRSGSVTIITRYEKMVLRGVPEASQFQALLQAELNKLPYSEFGAYGGASASYMDREAGRMYG